MLKDYLNKGNPGVLKSKKICLGKHKICTLIYRRTSSKVNKKSHIYLPGGKKKKKAKEENKIPKVSAKKKPNKPTVLV